MGRESPSHGIGVAERLLWGGSVETHGPCCLPHWLPAAQPCGLARSEEQAASSAVHVWDHKSRLCKYRGFPVYFWTASCKRLKELFVGFSCFYMYVCLCPSASHSKRLVFSGPACLCVGHIFTPFPKAHAFGIVLGVILYGAIHPLWLSPEMGSVIAGLCKTSWPGQALKPWPELLILVF